MRIFVRVAESGSFSATARELAIGQASVSRQVSELEASLKAKLFARTTRRVQLTDAGTHFYASAKALLEQFDMAVSELQHLNYAPSGLLRIASPLLFGRRHLIPVLAEFMTRHPEIVVEHYLSDARTDLVKEGIDVTVRMGRLEDSTHLARRLGEVPIICVASPDYLRRRTAPTHPSDLAQHECLVYLGFDSPFEWSFVAPHERITVAVEGRYRTNASEAILSAALSGMGVARGPSSGFAAELASGALTRVLPAYGSSPTAFFAVTPASSYMPLRTRLLLDFLQESFARHPAFAFPPV